MTPAAMALGRVLVLTVALVLIVTGIVTADGTLWPLTAVVAGVGLIGRMMWVATRAEVAS